MDNKMLLTVVLVLFAVVAAFVVFAPGPEQEASTIAWVATPGTAASEGTQDVQTTLASGARQVGEAQAPSDITSDAVTSPSHRMVATYFHNTTRCVTCRTIEQRAKETIESTFAAEVASGRVVWRALNMELKENEHYAIDYSLTSPSLVLTEIDGEREVRFKVLDQVWTLVHSKVPFASYIENETRAFLEEL